MESVDTVDKKIQELCKSIKVNKNKPLKNLTKKVAKKYPQHFDEVNHIKTVDIVDN